MKQQTALIETTFTQGQRVKVAPGDRYGRIECESNGRPGWYYVRFAEGGELDLVYWPGITGFSD